jgi:hypothetical protein
MQIKKSPKSLKSQLKLVSAFLYFLLIYIVEKAEMYNPYDFYFKKAKKEGYKARSAFKLEEIQDKFHLIDKHTKNVLDIGCAP